LAAHGLDIRQPVVNTVTADKSKAEVLDRFDVGLGDFAADERFRRDPRVLSAQIESELRDVMEGALTVESLFEREGRVYRFERKSGPTRVHFSDDEEIRVVTPARTSPGLLHLIARTVGEEGVNVEPVLERWSEPGEFVGYRFRVLNARGGALKPSERERVAGRLRSLLDQPVVTGQDFVREDGSSFGEVDPPPSDIASSLRPLWPRGTPEGVPAFEFLRALFREAPSVRVEKLPDHSGLRVLRLHAPFDQMAVVNPLRTIMNRLEAQDRQWLDFVYAPDGSLVAIHGPHDRYIDLSAYYFHWPTTKMYAADRREDLAWAWDDGLQRTTELALLAASYKPDAKPFFHDRCMVLAVDLKTHRLSVTYRAFLGGEEMPWDTNPKEGRWVAVVPVFPSVFTALPDDDRVFYDHLMGLHPSNFSFPGSPSSRQLILGTGSGVDSLLTRLSSSGDLWATDLNPFAVASARTLFRLFGQEDKATFQVLDNLTDEQGRAHFSRPFDRVIWNMPADPLKSRAEPVDLLAIHDGVSGTLERFVSALSGALGPDGRALIWNTMTDARWEKDRTIRVVESPGSLRVLHRMEERVTDWAVFVIGRREEGGAKEVGTDRPTGTTAESPTGGASVIAPWEAWIAQQRTTSSVPAAGALMDVLLSLFLSWPDRRLLHPHSRATSPMLKRFGDLGEADRLSLIRTLRHLWREKNWDARFGPWAAWAVPAAISYPQVDMGRLWRNVQDLEEPDSRALALALFATHLRRLPLGRHHAEAFAGGEGFIDAAALAVLWPRVIQDLVEGRGDAPTSPGAPSARDVALYAVATSLDGLVLRPGPGQTIEDYERQRLSGVKTLGRPREVRELLKEIRAIHEAEIHGEGTGWTARGFRQPPWLVSPSDGAFLSVGFQNYLTALDHGRPEGLPLDPWGPSRGRAENPFVRRFSGAASDGGGEKNFVGNVGPLTHEHRRELALDDVNRWIQHVESWMGTNDEPGPSSEDHGGGWRESRRAFQAGRGLGQIARGDGDGSTWTDLMRRTLGPVVPAGVDAGNPAIESLIRRAAILNRSSPRFFRAGLRWGRGPASRPSLTSALARLSRGLSSPRTSELSSSTLDVLPVRTAEDLPLVRRRMASDHPMLIALSDPSLAAVVTAEVGRRKNIRVVVRDSLFDAGEAGAVRLSAIQSDVDGFRDDVSFVRVVVRPGVDIRWDGVDASSSLAQAAVLILDVLGAVPLAATLARESFEQLRALAYIASQA
jgi:hypothetical protein